MNATQPKRAVRSNSRKNAPRTTKRKAAPKAVAASEERRTDELGEELGPKNIKRIPMGSRHKRLDAERLPGFYPHWFNDTHGQIERAKRAGFEHRRDESGKPFAVPAGTQEHGGGLRAYLMDQPQKFRDEDLAAKAAICDEIDRALNRGTFKEQPDDKRYIPEGGIKITGGASPRS